MAKAFRCTDIGMDCAWEAQAETAEGILGKAAEHAAGVHGIAEVSPELEAQVRAAIREV